MQELRRHLREVIQARYGGSVRKASIAVGLNANSLQVILDSPNTVPTLDTLDRLATTFDWPLESVIYWALGRQRPPPTDRARVLAEALTQIGVDEGLRQSLVDVVLRAAPDGTQ